VSNIEKIADALNEWETDILSIEGEWGWGRSIEQLREAKAGSVVMLDEAREALAELAKLQAKHDALEIHKGLQKLPPLQAIPGFLNG
jgi:hypothetical protein